MLLTLFVSKMIYLWYRYSLFFLLQVNIASVLWTIICGENVIWDVYKISCDIWRSSNTTADTVHRNRNDVSRFPISTLSARQEFVVFRVRYVAQSIVHFRNTRFNSQSFKNHVLCTNSIVILMLQNIFHILN